jgi:hypothetical protein
MGWPWTPLSFTWARHALPFNALREGHPSCGRFKDGPQGNLRPSSTPLDTPGRTPMERSWTHRPLVSQGVTGDFLCHFLFVEDSQFAVILDFDQLLAASGWIRDVQLHFYFTQKVSKN